MLVSDFNFALPDELIAQAPLEPRDAARMLVVDRAAHSFRNSQFIELPALLNVGDVLVVNNTRVFPARLLGHRVLPDSFTGAQIETLLAKRLDANTNEWEVIARPGRALKVGTQVVFGNGLLKGEITAVLDDGKRRIRFTCDGAFNDIVDRIGNTPLPPYIQREADEQHRLDEPRYQTVYAKERGAIAAPTAGMHFTERVFAELKARGIQIVEITHHVGYATFQPIRVAEVEAHRIESESYEISEEAAAAINAAKLNGQRVIAVGTTSTRALESAAASAANDDGTVRAERRATELFIYPGYRYKLVDGLLTNFHLPQSSLLMLVAALGGRELILSAYRHAVTERYRFYSYGDCMLIL
ncbi:MAG: tRNA preQ1(34) S-adenosylmethionine ribosyltransferase-isomerase QueA [Acidobacteria bacterium]|nr:tRNA preQ1(34) S-adenosylmethionine ribosyltransferase-isomerase QueA [Acidobacteriota bacterium]